MFVGEEGIGTSNAAVRDAGQLSNILSAINGTRLVIPDSLTALIIEADCSLYFVTAKPGTSDISKDSFSVRNALPQDIQIGAPLLEQIMHGIGKSKFSNLDTRKV